MSPDSASIKLPRHTSSRPPNSLHARSAVWRTVPTLYFHVSFAVFLCWNTYCLRQHSHRTVEAGWHLRQSGPGYGALTVRGISGAHQRPAPQKSADATALMRAVRRAIDDATEPWNWDVAATYRGPAESLEQALLGD